MTGRLSREGAAGIYAALMFAAALPLHAQGAPALDPPRLALDKLPVTARIDLPSSADWIAFGFGSVWVVNYRPDRVSRIDTATNRVTADIAIGRNGCLGVVAGSDRVWVPTCGDGVINEIDPKTDSIVRRIPVPIKRGREGAFAFASGSFWIPDNVSDSSSSTVARVDARSGAVLSRIATGARSDVVIAGFGSVWVASSAENVVVRIDPSNNGIVAPYSSGAVAQVHDRRRRRGVGSESRRRLSLAHRSGDESRGRTRRGARADAGGRHFGGRWLRLVERRRNAGHAHRSAHEHGDSPVRGRQRSRRNSLGSWRALGRRSQDWTALAHRCRAHSVKALRDA